MKPDLNPSNDSARERIAISQLNEERKESIHNWQLSNINENKNDSESEPE